MEYEDYVHLHEKFGMVNTKLGSGETEPLTNPYYLSMSWQTSYSPQTKEIRSSWFTLTKTQFILTTDYNRPYNVGANEFHKPKFNLMLPASIKLTVLSDKEFALNGYPAHKELTIDIKSGKAIFYKDARYPASENERKQAVSVLRKHVMAYKKKARPIFRLLEGSLTQDVEGRSTTVYQSSRANGPSIGSHELYEILRQRAPTPDQINRLMQIGNQSVNYSALELTSFESSLARLVQRHRAKLQPFALLEANDHYKSPNELKINYIGV